MSSCSVTEYKAQDAKHLSPAELTQISIRNPAAQESMLRHLVSARWNLQQSSRALGKGHVCIQSFRSIVISY